MAQGDIYLVYEERGGWTVMMAEGKDFKKYGTRYYKALRAAKDKALREQRDLVVNYKDGRTGRYYYEYNADTDSLEQST